MWGLGLCRAEEGRRSWRGIAWAVDVGMLLGAVVFTASAMAGWIAGICSNADMYSCRGKGVLIVKA